MEYERNRDHSVLLGQHDSINKRYTNLLLVLKHRNEEEREHEIKQMGRKHLDIMNTRALDEYQPTSIQTIFDPGEGGHVPETMVLKGPAGIGKTTTVQKIGVCVNPSQETSMEDLLNSILRKKILPRASPMITTRPYILGRLEEFVQSPCYFEVLGFDENSEEYFYNFFLNKEQAERAVKIIKENETLFTMCVVPNTCWIVCTVTRQQMERGLNVANTYHGRDSNLNCVKNLCALAKDGIMEQKILFDKNDIEDQGLTVSEIESTFLNKNIFQRTICPYTTYSPIHLNVQEFFAALYYVLSEDTDRSDSSEGSNMEVMDLLENSLENQHLTVRFLFGLCGEEQKKEIEKNFGCKILLRIKSSLDPWLREKKQSVISRDFLAYLYEIQDKDLVGRMMSQYKDIDIFDEHV
ncbi:NACHT, LRR and PYD domains-containing protein 3-like [Discoglossus pictus]